MEGNAEAAPRLSEGANYDEHKCYRFEGKVIIITGGGGAIGYAAAERLAGEGGNCVLTDICAEDRL